MIYIGPEQNVLASVFEYGDSCSFSLGRKKYVEIESELKGLQLGLCSVELVI